MSFGPLAGSAATRIVCARSCALMPVVIPNLGAASMLTVYAVRQRVDVAFADRREPELVDALAA